jgi:uncharacterized protein YjdB
MRRNVCLTLLSVSLAAACDQPVQQPIQPAAIEVLTQKAVQGEVGEAVPIDVRVRVLSTTQVPVAGAVVAFQASHGGNAAPPTVVTDASGTAATSWWLGTAVGEQLLRGTVVGAPDISAEIVATALPGPAAQLTVMPSTLGLVAGVEYSLAAAARDRFGNAITDRAVEWRSEDSSVATVSDTGRVRGLRAGTTRVIASLDAATASVLVQVVVLAGSTPAVP